MTGEDSSDPSVDTVAGVVGDRTASAFELLGNETRLTILLALWDAYELTLPFTLGELSFSELRQRTGVRDSGQFNYHLDKLEGRYVDETDEGYALTPRALHLMQTVLAGTLTDQSSFEGGPLPEACPDCGGTEVVEYDDGVLAVRCTDCGGGWGTAEFPPAGLEGRTSEEVSQAGQTLLDHRLLTMQQGICPICAGRVTRSLFVCDDHDADDGTHCERCGRTTESLVCLFCDICKYSKYAHPDWFAQTLPPVRTFFQNHGIDIISTSRHDGVPRDAQAFEVLSTEPPEVRVRVALGGDRLEVTLDEAAQVTDVTGPTE